MGVKRRSRQHSASIWPTAGPSARTIRAVAVNHYENFPVASWLCPPSVRPAVMAIYRFARTADDIADEGQASAEARLADLAEFRADLVATAGGERPSLRWPDVFGPLRAVIMRFHPPLALLMDLLSAFEQDVRKCRYADRIELLDYCSRSANPVGRLMLHLYGITESIALRRSDAICTALQLTNFWQDLGLDVRRGRHYVPQSDCARHGIAASTPWGPADEVGMRAMVMDLVEWTRSIMHQGAPLVHQVHGRAGWELRLVVQGGLRILEKIDHLNGATLAARPVLRSGDVPLVFWRALTMTNHDRHTAPEF